MAAAYALISILSATAGVVALWPSFGWWSVASIWPVGGASCLIAAALVGLLRSGSEVVDLDQLADDMVSDLRGVLAEADRPASGPSRPDTASKRHQATG